MPGVIMENGNRHGAHTNHDRDPLPNGINGGIHNDSRTLDKGKELVEPRQNITPTSPSIPNGLNGGYGSISNLQEHLDTERARVPSVLKERLHQLPPEVKHITQGYMPLSTLLKRLAEKTHNGLTNKIMELASMPVPTSAQHVGPSGLTEVDDLSPENLAKKKALLDFAQSTHADWVKALVITNWSRRSEDVSKTIDLNVHTNEQKNLYDQALYELAVMKRSLGPARLPNPDLRTALQTLSTGKAPNMPHLGFIEPPPLTARDLLKELENLNILLSIRLNLHEHDNIPLPFRNYEIKSGRVTFRVPGEFELDLTIADEDPEKQFWFIDFRFLFSPSLEELPFALRFHIEHRVNSVLLAEGLPGCYRVLHEMVLTHKISEFRRQAFHLARGKWIDGLKVEALNRSLSIQYWLDRYTKTGPKSWIILGVHSGRRKDGRPDPKKPSHLSLRWFRDGKEIKDEEIPFDSTNISAKTLLKTIIAKHTSHIMTSIHQQLATRPLYQEGDASLSLTLSSDEPSESLLEVQLTRKENVSITIEPITGRFVFSPACIMNSRMEAHLNNTSKDPAKDASGSIEALRTETVDREITSYAISVGWMRYTMRGMSYEVIKARFPKGTSKVLWYRKNSWKRDWYMAVTISMSGEQWWLAETTPDPTNPPMGLKVGSLLRIPLQSKLAVPAYDFLSSLNLFAAALLFHYSNLKALHHMNAQHKLRHNKKNLPIKVPSIYLRLGQILPKTTKSSNPWAHEVLKVTFMGLEAISPSETVIPASSNPSNLPTPATQSQSQVQAQPIHIQERDVVITEARIVVVDRSALSLLSENFDKDIAFDNKSGSFAIRIRSVVGESIVKPLVENLNRIGQFVEFINVLDKHKDALHSETPSLNKLIFSYGPLPASTDSDSTVPRPYRATITFGAVQSLLTLKFDNANPHLRISDFLTNTLNSPPGLDAVATLLPMTLPALGALDTIERNWVSLSDRGTVTVFVRAVEWYIIRYTLTPPTTKPNLPPRRITFELKIQTRKGEAWWYVRRTDNREKDEIDTALKTIWNSKGTDWDGMRVSAVARPAGATDLFAKIDEVMRTVDLSKPMPAPTAPVAPMLQVPMQAQGHGQGQGQNKGVLRQPMQQRQQPTPNHSQNQGQARHNPLKREVVEID